VTNLQDVGGDVSTQNDKLTSCLPKLSMRERKNLFCFWNTGLPWNQSFVNCRVQEREEFNENNFKFFLLNNSKENENVLDYSEPNTIFRKNKVEDNWWQNCTPNKCISSFLHDGIALASCRSEREICTRPTCPRFTIASECCYRIIPWETDWN